MEFRLPELGEGVYEAEMTRWLVNEGDTVKPGQVLLEVLTDKANMEVPAPFAGTIEKLHLEEGQKVKIGDVVLSYSGKDAETRAAKTVVAAPTAARKSTVEAAAPRSGNGAAQVAGLAVKAAPSVRLLARKLGIDISRVRGSGPQGRVLVEDLTPLVQGSSLPSPQPPELRADYGTPGARIKLIGLRRKIAEHMVHAKHTIPHYTYVDECDVTELVKLRDAVRESLHRKGVKLTYLAFFVKAAIHALKEVPLVNASLDEGAGEIILHDKYHIGIAVAAPGGLIVPVIHDADKLSLLDIAREIERLSQDARTGKSKLEDLRGGTFTLTSIGNIGGLFATPIIPHPQVGILGVGKIVKRPVCDALSQVRPADMVYLSLSFDHRVLDGAIGTAFGNVVMERIKNPAALLVE